MPAASLRPPLSPRRRRAFRLAAIVVGLSMLALAEGVCLLFDWGRPTDVDDPFVGFSRIHPLFVQSEGGTRYVVPPSRLKFFAPDSFAAQKPPDEFRIFVLGESTVQGRPYSTPTSFATWLELALPIADPQRRWDVVNCGGISYASYRLVPVLKECLTHQPDLIVLCVGHNEFLEDRTYGDVKRMPAWRMRVRESFRQRRLVTLLTKVVRGNAATDPPANVLADDADAMLNYHNGLAAYHRDDAWREGVVAHYEFNMRRMLALCREADVPVWVLKPLSNLADSPPFKSEHGFGLGANDLAEWERLVGEARERYRTDIPGAIARLQQAIAIDDEFAGVWFELGRCYEAERKWDRARDAFVRARDEDICPLRMLSTMETSLIATADEAGAPYIDLHALLEQQSRHGILGDKWLVDHIHPSFEGHQAIATRLVEELAAQGMASPSADWQEKVQPLWQSHFDALDAMYFYRGQAALEGLRAWTRGQASGPPIETRFPERLRPESGPTDK